MKQGGFHSAGFTVVETLIVLTVTSLLAVSAMLLINGRQQKTEFQTAIHDLQQQLQQAVNEVQTGYYPNQGGFSCSVPAPGSRPIISTATSTQQGQNSDCIFLGKVLYFGPGQSTNQFGLYPVAGGRQASNGRLVDNLAAAWPTAIPASISSTHMENQLSFVGANGDTSGRAFLAGMFSTLGAAADAGVSGTQTFRLYNLNPSYTFGAPTNSNDVVQVINGATSSAVATQFTVAASNTTICIASGSTDQSGLFTISPSLAVTLQIKGGLTC